MYELYIKKEVGIVNINNLYNFKNPVRHFLDISGIYYNVNIENIDIKNLSWTVPINFRIKKDEDKHRILKIPNILNFICAYERFKDYPNFNNVNLIDIHKKLVPNLETGDFAAGEYDFQLEEDFYKLCVYDNLLKLDIKSYYGRIYTHDINFEKENDENYLTNLNKGNTNGIIMGNYISLYFAEVYLKNISEKIEIELNNKNIDCCFSYFSDDFYFFCNTEDNEKIIDIFDSVLEIFDLERNDKKIEIWTYLDYNDYNLVEKYWKKIQSESEARFRYDVNDNSLYFINQLIYRMSNLKDDKSKRTFLNTFFKSTYFQEIEISKYKLEDFNSHQLCYMFKMSPEIMLYSIHIFKYFDYFIDSKFEKFLKVRYREALLKNYNEEQLYYYYTIKTLDFNSILLDNINLVYNSNNQLLISYYLKDNLFNDDIIDKLKEKEDEEYWFQNYHLILYTNLKDNLEESINKYLIPKYAWDPKHLSDDVINTRKSFRVKQETYLTFYRTILELEIPIIKNIDEVENNIKNYIDLKINEKKDVFGE